MNPNICNTRDKIWIWVSLHCECLDCLGYPKLCSPGAYKSVAIFHLKYAGRDAALRHNLTAVRWSTGYSALYEKRCDGLLVAGKGIFPSRWLEKFRPKLSTQWEMVKIENQNWSVKKCLKKVCNSARTGGGDVIFSPTICLTICHPNNPPELRIIQPHRFSLNQSPLHCNTELSANSLELQF